MIVMWAQRYLNKTFEINALLKAMVLDIQFAQTKLSNIF